MSADKIAVIRTNIGLLRKLPLEVAEEVVKRTVEKAATLAKQKVRVDLGNLKLTINAKSEGLAGEIWSDADYALIQEYGPKDASKGIERKNTEAKSGEGGPYTYSPYLRPAASKAGSQEEIDKSTTAAMRRYDK